MSAQSKFSRAQNFVCTKMMAGELTYRSCSIVRDIIRRLSLSEADRPASREPPPAQSIMRSQPIRRRIAARIRAGPQPARQAAGLDEQLKSVFDGYGVSCMYYRVIERKLVRAGWTRSRVLERVCESEESGALEVRGGIVCLCC